jgi:hypothetical protein
VNVLVETHGWDEVSATDQRKVPDEDADQIDKSVNVSDVPPLVQADGATEIDNADPDALVVRVTCLRALLPTETLFVPAAPGDPV